MPTGSPAIAKTIGMVDVACLATSACASPVVRIEIHLEPDELGRDFGKTLGAALRPAILDSDGATFDPAEFAQPLREGSRRHGLISGSRGPAEVADSRPLLGLLRACRERPGERRAGNRCDEVASSHQAPKVGMTPSRVLPTEG